MNVAGTVNTDYAGCRYRNALGTAQARIEDSFAPDGSFDDYFKESYLGMGFLEGESGSRYGICAEYAKCSTKEQPVVAVTVQTEHGWEIHEVDIKKIRPEHATELEMFALCSYADANGMGVESNLSTWQTLQYFKEDAVRSGYMEDQALDGAADWRAMVNCVRRDYCSAGMIGEYHSAQKINAMFDNFEDRITFGGAYVFRMPCVGQATAEERELGFAYLRYSEESAFGLKAEYAKNADMDSPVVKVTVHDNGQEEEYYVNLKDVNPRHATEIEMFALVSYMDANGLGAEFSANTWQRLKELRKDGLTRGYCGEISKDIEESGLENVKMDWVKLLEMSAGNLWDNGNQEGAAECEDLIEKLNTVTSGESYMDGKEFSVTDGSTENKGRKTEDNEEADIYEKAREGKKIGEYTTKELIERIREEIEKIREKVKNGDTEVSFQIGGASFTIREWDKLLEKFDTVQEAIKEQIKEEIAKRNDKKVKEHYETEANDVKTDVLVESLVTESTVSSYSYEEEPERKFITWYTEEGICCREEGQTEGYYYKINFDKPGQYREVMDFLGKLSKDADLSFTANKHFWRDFLNGTLDKEKFLSFINNNPDEIMEQAKAAMDLKQMLITNTLQYNSYRNPVLFHNIYSQEEFQELMAAKMIKGFGNSGMKWEGNPHDALFEGCDGNVRKIWEELEAEMGFYGIGVDDDGKFLYISEYLKQRFLSGGKGIWDSPLGTTAESAVSYAKKALHSLKHPVSAELDPDENPDKQREKEFYEKFLERLNRLLQ